MPVVTIEEYANGWLVKHNVVAKDAQNFVADQEVWQRRWDLPPQWIRSVETNRCEFKFDVVRAG